jgi:UDP-N-acetyl-2-amino-2-deoxyglucuronate dehydrogenase
VKRFAIIGIGGYVAPRHLKAIKETGNNLIAGLDPSDSVGIMDSYFPDASFFTEFERFDRYIDKCRMSGQSMQFLTVCSPNYLHDAHVRYGLRMNTDVICEKPLVLNPWNLDALAALEKETGKHIYTILQLRHHPDIIAVKDKLGNQKVEVELTYIAPRGQWYYASWKGNEEKSGGIATNIGIHFFDMLIWMFGSVQRNDVHLYAHDRAAGYLEMEHANVKWFLSINAQNLPSMQSNSQTYRSIKIDGAEIEFSQGFENLHTVSYNEILHGRGFGIMDVRPSLDLTYQIRNATPKRQPDNEHPYCNLPLSPHPFSHKS